MRENNLARRYALGLLKTVSSEGEYTTLHDEVLFFKKLLAENEDFRSGLESTLFSMEQKEELLNAIHQKVQFNQKTYNFLMTVLEENRVQILDSIIEVLEKLWLEQNHIEKLTVYSPIPLTETLEAKLVDKLSKAFHKKILLDKKIDKSLIAGIKIQKGSVFYDFSIAGNLNKLRESLLEDN